MEIVLGIWALGLSGWTLWLLIASIRLHRAGTALVLERARWLRYMRIKYSLRNDYE